MTRGRPRLVGAFVLGALLLMLAGIAWMSARRLFASYRTYVVFFPYAVGGLRAGSPVTFRQVQVGHVRDVDLVFTGETFDTSWIMAVIEVRKGALRNPKGEASQLTDAELAKVMIDSGLRASVRQSSLIAGQKSVDLDFNPDAKPRLSGIPSPYTEIPSAPTGMEVLNERVEATLKKISDVPIDEVLLQLDTTLESLQRVLDKGDVPATLGRLRVTLDTATRTLAAAEKTMAGAGDIGEQAKTTMASMDQTMKGVQKTLDRLETTLATVDRSVEGTADIRVETARTIDEMNELLKSLRAFVETLQQHPEALLRGKEQQKK
jgi:paraquat-inducible protein B